MDALLDHLQAVAANWLWLVPGLLAEGVWVSSWIRGKREQRPSPAWAVAIFFAALIPAQFMAWNDLHREHEQHNGMSAVVKRVAIGDAQGKAGIVFNIDIVNRGEPSIAHEYRLEVTRDGNRVKVTRLENAEITFQSEYGRPSIRVSPEESLETKTSTPMTKGERRSGTVAFLADMPVDRAREPGVTMKILFTDSYGHTHEVVPREGGRETAW